jgi:simple sugar transport system permease protein
LNNQPSTQKDAGKIILEETIQPTPTKAKKGWGRVSQTVLIPILAVITGLIFGAIFIIITSEQVYAGFNQSFGAGLAAAWKTVATSYGALFAGSIGDPARIVAAFQSGNTTEIYRAINPFLESLVASTPYIFGGLAVALGFRAGVFNIGVEGQIFLGAIFAALVGYSIKGLPTIIHLPLTFLAGAVGGGLWGLIPGWLKAKTGGHEVINTIMMNYIAFRLSEYLLNGPMKRPGSVPISPTIEQSAWFPRFF